MGEWEREVGEKSEEQTGKRPKWWKRFVDDIIGIWKGTKEEFTRFVEICNKNEERIKVTYDICEKEAIFLDVKMTKQERGKLKTELYVKPTDRTRLQNQASEPGFRTRLQITQDMSRRV